MPGTPRADPDVQYYRIRFLGCTRFCGAKLYHHLVCYFPQGGWLMLFQPYSVRHKFPLRVTYFRRVLPHVRGFPARGVLRSIRLPQAFGVFSFSQSYTAFLFFCFRPSLRLGLSSVSRFPFTCLNIPMPYDGFLQAEEPVGPPKFFVVSVPACHSLRTPADFHILTMPDASYWLRGR